MIAYAGKVNYVSYTYHLRIILETGSQCHDRKKASFSKRLFYLKINLFEI